MRTSRYKIFETDDDQFQYQLIAKNGKVILTSIKEPTIKDILNLIKKTFDYGRNMTNFDMLLSSDYKFYFNVIDHNKDTIATSNLYKTERGLISGCNSIMDNCETCHISYIIGNKLT